MGRLEFRDNFSQQSAEYARFRPRYPRALFEWLASLCTARNTAWDCGTGNGQCAISLAEFFHSVIATDASEKQLASAEANPRIQYRRATAEDSGLASNSVDLVTVAQALHWFRIEKFWGEARRVAHAEAVIAVWCYAFLEVTPEIDILLNQFYSDIVGPYWDFERKLVEDGYRSVSFPFREMETPPFQIEEIWSLPHLLGYLRSWSSTQKYIAANGTDPVELVADGLEKAWGDPAGGRPVKWPLRMRVGRNISG